MAQLIDPRSSSNTGEQMQFVPVHLHGDLAYARHREEEKLAKKKPVGAVYDEQPQRTEAQQIAYACGIATLAPVVQRLIDAEAKIEHLLGRVAELEKKSAYPVHLKNVERR